MNDRFNNVDPEKQQQILHAALQEFAENGYEQASTNTIVKQANIGKGMLFYYFGSKQDLFYFLVDYAIRKANEDYLDLIDPNEPDFLKRMRNIAQVKVNFYHAYPQVSNFISSVYLDESIQLPSHLKEMLVQFEQKIYKIMYSGVDQSLFREDVDVEKAYQLIRWSLEGYQNDLLQKLGNQKIAAIDLNPYWDEFYGYLDILEKLFYKS